MTMRCTVGSSGANFIFVVCQKWEYPIGKEGVTMKAIAVRVDDKGRVRWPLLRGWSS